MQTGRGRKRLMLVQTFGFKFKTYLDFQKEKGIHKWAGIVIKNGKKIMSNMKRL